MLCVYGMIYGLYYFVGMCSKFLRIMYDFGLGYVMVICKQEFLYIITFIIVVYGINFRSKAMWWFLAYESFFILSIFSSSCMVLTLGQRLITFSIVRKPQSPGTLWRALKEYKTYFVKLVCVEEHGLEELMVLTTQRAHIKTG